MKKSYKRLIIFQAILGLFLILNSFVYNFLSGYVTVAFLLIFLLIFKFVCGLEKDRHRYVKDIIFEIIIFIIVFFLLYYLFGLIIGFYKTSNYYNLNGLFKFIIPTILTITVTEMLRYAIITKSQESKKLIVLNCLVFIFLDITSAIYYGNFTTPRNIFLFCALSLLPAITKNILGIYISLKYGYKPMIFYLLSMSLYQYLLPIVPNPNEFLVSIIQFLLPIALLIKIIAFTNKEKDEEIEREYRKKHILPYIVPTILVILSVYFTSGYFRLYAVAIASGSMTPNINKGDVAIIDKKYNELKIGDVIAFKKGDVIIVHRLINIVSAGDEKFYYTKGDANTNPDGYSISQKQIVGIVNVKIPYIGIPTVWVNEL